MEHAIRLLHDIERLAASLRDCRTAEEAAIAAACSRALQSSNWLDVTTNLEEAQRRTAQIKSANCK